MEKHSWKLQRSLSIIIIAFVFFLGMSRANSNTEKRAITCETNERMDEIININETKRVLGDAVRVLRGVKLEKREECKAECCNTLNCNVYVFYNRLGNSANCFLVKCLPKESCVYSKLADSVVGIRELNAGFYQNEDSQKRNMNSTPATTVMVLDGNMTTKVPTSEINENIVNATSAPVANITMMSEIQATSTPNSLIEEKHAQDENNHTTVASLVIALFFGILFLFAVFLLIGRPWWDSFHRPRYSKVDYLMNGL